MIEFTFDATRNKIVAADVCRLYSPQMQSEPPAIAANRFSGEETNRNFYLPRLTREHYQGDTVIHWTMPVALRGTGWLNELFHARFREAMLHAAAREGLFCPSYCLMPDHIHLLWMGLRRDSDQRNGMKFLREHLGTALHPHRFQHQAHDHVLREEERQRGAIAEPSSPAIPNCIRWMKISGPNSGNFTLPPVRRMPVI